MTLGKPGQALWDTVTADWELHAGERAILRQACVLEDQIAACDEIVAREGVMTRGSRDQPIAHPMVGLGKQLRSTQAQLIGKLQLEDHPEEPQPPGKHHGKGRRKPHG